jgi:hypothetical protein
MFVNLTPHDITLRDPNGDDVTVAPSGTVARVSTSTTTTRVLAGLPVRVKVLGAVVGLPDPDGVSVFIVSGAVRGALQEKGSSRADVVAPATGPHDGAIRNDAGHVVAVTQLDGLA